jgi:thiosulfate/3-mercaptopyruvate sulfurtransferase
VTFTTLIETEALAARLSDPGLVIVDCRFDLADTAQGERAYAEKHIPGAGYAHLDRDLSGTKTGRNGRHPLPDPYALARTFGSLGIGEGTQVIAYDQDAGMYASRLWWELRWLGHGAVAVLDGGFAKWIGEGRPTAAGVETRPARPFTPRPREDMVATLAEIDARRADNEWRLVDARAPERFRGEHETLDKAAGHIPGAVNHFFRTNLDDRGTFRSPDELRVRARETIGDVPPERIVCYCGSGVTACHNLLAMEHAGMHGAKLYAGSWSEWSSDASRPVSREDS